MFFRKEYRVHAITLYLQHIKPSISLNSGLYFGSQTMFRLRTSFWCK